MQYNSQPWLLRYLSASLGTATPIFLGTATPSSPAGWTPAPASSASTCPRSGQWARAVPARAGRRCELRRQVCSGRCLALGRKEEGASLPGAVQLHLRSWLLSGEGPSWWMPTRPREQQSPSLERRSLRVLNAGTSSCVCRPHCWVTRELPVLFKLELSFWPSPPQES